MTGRTTSSEPPRFAPFGRYLLLERIAVGGMAEVYLAKRFEADQVSDLIAIKRIKPSLAENDDFIRMFLDEAKIAGRLSHPGIARILELGRIGRSHYLAMDFVWGKDLLQIMRRVKLLGAQLSPSFVAWTGIGMLEALDAAHRLTDRHGKPMGLIHRDVSPQNVLVSFDGVVKLIDFGIAKAQSRSTETQAGVLKGKVGYMSPEQVKGSKIDGRSDLFAVGTCLYELLTLRTLFARENAFEALENVKYVKAEPIGELRPDVPEALASILLRAHAADPAERWQSAAEMAAALRAFVAAHEPGYDRVSLVTWMRDAFRKELHTERVRLDAFDQLGRPQVTSADEPRRNSVTDLQIEDPGDPEPPDWDQIGETIISDEPLPFRTDAPLPEDDGPTEVYFHRDDVSTPGAPVDPRALADDLDVSLEPSQIDSAVIERLLPSAEEKAAAAREPTQRNRVSTEVIGPPSAKRGAGSWLLRVVVALALVALGAGGLYAYMASALVASIEVRTTPANDAVVLLDGVRRGTAPVRLENVGAGHHVVTILAPGFEDVTREIEVTSDSTVIVEVALQPRAPP
ncbi:MAG: serine/threonine protein kinase [Sandaracinaceae bacterium]|nr:serine/threonine protein kinase [Sandaracinaceae bacterium]